MKVRILEDSAQIDRIVDIHINSFKGFFLTFLGERFLKQLYKGFLFHDNSGILVAVENNNIVGFLAYSCDLSSFYKFLIRTNFIKFALYSLKAVVLKPKIVFKLFKALGAPSKAKESDSYINLSSIGVDSTMFDKSVGSQLISKLKELYREGSYSYIKLDTDAENNEKANYFYEKNGFNLEKKYTTSEGRRMNEYRFYF